MSDIILNLDKGKQTHFQEWNSYLQLFKSIPKQNLYYVLYWDGIFDPNLGIKMFLGFFF